MRKLTGPTPTSASEVYPPPRNAVKAHRNVWHAGRWLYNENRSAGFRIAAFVGGKFELEGVEGDLDAIFADPHGDGRRQFWISDIGPGDDFRIPSVAHIKRTMPNVYEVGMMTEVSLTVPEGRVAMGDGG